MFTRFPVDTFSVFKNSAMAAHARIIYDRCNAQRDAENARARAPLARAESQQGPSVEAARHRLNML